VTHRVLGLNVLASLLVLSCGSPPAPGVPSGSEANRPGADEAAAPASSAARTEPPPADPSEGRPVAQAQGPDWTPAADGVDGWLQSKGIADTSSEALVKAAGLPESTRVECDRVIPVGKPVGEAALCRRQYKDGLWVLGTSFLLLAADNGRLRKVWEMPSAVGQLSTQDVSETPFVQLNLSVQDDGMLLFLEEVEGLGCGDWRARVAAARKDAEPEEKDTFVALERLAARVCQGKGRYAWRGSSFAR